MSGFRLSRCQMNRVAPPVAAFDFERTGSYDFSVIGVSPITLRGSRLRSRPRLLVRQIERAIPKEGRGRTATAFEVPANWRHEHR